MKIVPILLILSQIFIGCHNNFGYKKHYGSNLDERIFNNGIIDIILAINRTKINALIQDTIINKIILQEHMDKIDLAANLEKLYYINILGYLSKNEMYFFNSNYVDERLIEYIVTFEIGYGISPLASENGNSCNQIYKEDIVYNDKSIGTIRVWQINNSPTVDFIFVVFDKDYNIFYRYILLK
ncbi:MAG: hypothetical protein LBQ93_08280 [Treponema sp.]|jgi:hypothetical protein|nr:hypothetical protein [Treponema sp.]